MSGDGHNTRAFMLAIMERFTRARVAIWLSGGWAEELWGMRPAGPHHDIDLLYTATDFDDLDCWLATNPDLVPIEGKRFPHKRAVLCEQVMVEMTLLEPQGYVTDFFGGRYRFTWPDDSLGYLTVEDKSIPLVRPHALRAYRQHHVQIEEAYLAWCRERSGL